MTYPLLLIAFFIIFMFIKDNKTSSIEETEIGINRAKSMLKLVPIIFGCIAIVAFIMSYPVTNTVTTAPFPMLQEKLIDITIKFGITLFVMVEVFYIWTLVALKARLEKLKNEIEEM